MAAPRPDRPQVLLLKAALLDDAAATVAWAEWLALESRSKVDPSLGRVLPLLHRRLGGAEPLLGDQGLDGARILVAQASATFEQTRYRNALLFGEASDAVGALDVAGIPVCLLKGAALSIVAYRDPALRPMSDVDFLVKIGDLPATIEVLRDAGWKTPVSFGPQEIASTHSAPFTNETLGSIDLHWRSLDSVAEDEADVRLWDASTPAKLGDVVVRVPAHEDLLLHACVGGQRWEGDVVCRWIADAHLIVTASDSKLDWDRFGWEAAQHDETATVTDALQYLHATFGTPIPESARGFSIDSRGPRTSRAARARQRAPEERGPILALALHFDRHERLASRGAATAGPLGFLRTVARTWGVSLWLLPFHALYRGARRLSQIALRSVRPGGSAWG
jgi:hypothetical protein